MSCKEEDSDESEKPKTIDTMKVVDYKMMIQSEIFQENIERSLAINRYTWDFNEFMVNEK